MMFSLLRLTVLLILTAVFAAAEPMMTIQRSSRISDVSTTLLLSSQQSKQSVKIAVLSSPKVIGKYSQSIYNVSLATLIALQPETFDVHRYDIDDESTESIDRALRRIREDGMNAILAPLTANGVRNLLSLETRLKIFVPTVHRRDFGEPPANITFGAIDYQAQIEALSPYMSDSIAVFYDKSAVGEQLKNTTENLFLSQSSTKKRTANAYPVDIKGDKIVSHLANPSAFNKKSVIMHIPVVKSSVLASHLTFSGVKEKNILSTQINVDPTLLTLTQYHDRNNMILANSLVEFPPSIYETNALLGNDLAYDWVLYTSSVGIDHLVSHLTQMPRTYTMRTVHSQVIYPIELLQPKESGFEPLRN